MLFRSEASVSLDAGDQPRVSLYREPDPLQSITLLGTDTLSGGSLSAIHNGFGLFRVAPPERAPVPAPRCSGLAADGGG